ncbi:MAG: hypothetical protein HY842_17150 [Bacteroidetes bacterium]|nr:hypothetical protein [Bacteroidota bacterium]
MSAADLFSGLGVSLILLAYLGSSLNKLNNSSVIYWLLNLAGGISAATGAALMESIPFLILEATWTVTSVFGLVKCLKKNAATSSR